MTETIYDLAVIGAGVMGQFTADFAGRMVVRGELPAAQCGPTTSLAVARVALGTISGQQRETRYAEQNGSGEPDPHRYAHPTSLAV